MSLLSTQKPLRGLLASKETASTIVAIPAGTQPLSVITATYDTGVETPIVSNKAGILGALSPIDGASQQILTDVEVAVTDTLVKIGECADCSSDLYADSETANAMTDCSFTGACVMCGARTSFRSTGETAQIATSTYSNANSAKSEIANYFDFSELNTVDPNKIEENDMSNKRAKEILRASVAEVLASINSHVEMAEDDVEVLPSDDEANLDDFAEESEDELDAMDMAESDPAVDDEDVVEEDVEVEEASAEADTNGSETTEVVEADPVTETACDSEEVAEGSVEDSEEIDGDVDTANADDSSDEVANDTTIEYQAATLEQLSPEADFVKVSETAYYLVQDSSPVARLNKEQASEGAQAIWNKPVELRNAYRAGLNGDRSLALASLGGSILTVNTKVANVVAERITKQETAAAQMIEESRAALGTKLRQCLEIAALGTVKGMLGPNIRNDVADELAGVLAANGVREPGTIVTASMIESMPKFINTVLAKAFELANESSESLNAKAELIGNSQGVPVVNITSAEAPKEEPKPAVVETAAVIEAPRYNFAAIANSLGRRVHAL